MTILIIGSKGFIGSHLVAHFSNNHHVIQCDVAAIYSEKNYYRITNPEVDFLNLFKSEKNIDFCINASGAAHVQESIKNPIRDFKLNVQNVLFILDSIRTLQPVCKFINLSSAAVYGNPKILPVSESHDKCPVSPYGYHKLMAENICQEYNEVYKVRSCSARIFSAYGPGLEKQIFWDLANKVVSSRSELRLFGTGNETRDFIFIDDVCRALDTIIHKDSFDIDIINIASGVSHSISQVAHLLIKCLGIKKEIIFEGVVREGDPDYWSADIGQLTSMGFEPQVNLEDGLREYTAWFKENMAG